MLEDAVEETRTGPGYLLEQVAAVSTVAAAAAVADSIVVAIVAVSTVAVVIVVVSTVAAVTEVPVAGPVIKQSDV